MLPPTTLDPGQERRLAKKKHVRIPSTPSAECGTGQERD